MIQFDSYFWSGLKPRYAPKCNWNIYHKNGNKLMVNKCRSIFQSHLPHLGHSKSFWPETFLSWSWECSDSDATNPPSHECSTFSFWDHMLMTYDERWSSMPGVIQVVTVLSGGHQQSLISGQPLKGSLQNPKKVTAWITLWSCLSAWWFQTCFVVFTCT